MHSVWAVHCICAQSTWKGQKKNLNKFKFYRMLVDYGWNSIVCMHSRRFGFVYSMTTSIAKRIHSTRWRIIWSHRNWNFNDGERITNETPVRLLAIAINSLCINFALSIYSRSKRCRNNLTIGSAYPQNSAWTNWNDRVARGMLSGQIGIYAGYLGVHHRECLTVSRFKYKFNNIPIRSVHNY